MQHEDFVEIIQQVGFYKAKMKEIARRNIELENKIAQQNSLLEDDNRELMQINRTIGAFLLNNLLTTVPISAERENIILAKHERERQLFSITAEYNNIKDEVEHLTTEFTKKLQTIVEGSAENLSSEVESDEEDYKFERITFKRPVPVEDKSIEGRSIKKQPKMEILENTTQKVNSASSHKKYKYEYLKFETDSTSSTEKNILNRLQPRKISVHVKKNGVMYYSCRSCNKKFSAEESITTNNGQTKCFVTIFSIYQKKLCDCS